MADDTTFQLDIALTPRGRELQEAVSGLSEELAKAPETELSRAAKRLLQAVESSLKVPQAMAHVA